MRRNRPAVALGLASTILAASLAGRIAADHSGRYAHDHALIAQTVAANDSMRASCHGWASLELKADGSSEVIGHCPRSTR